MNWVHILLATSTTVLIYLLWSALFKSKTVDMKSDKKNGSKKIRKRDTVAFLSRKVIHRMSTLKKQIEGMKSKKRRLQMFKLKSNTIDQPCCWDEENFHHFSNQLDYMGRTLTKIFHFSPPVAYKILKSASIVTVEKGKMLFGYGEQLSPIYLIQSGEIDLYVMNDSNTEVLLRSFRAGESIFSVTLLLEQILTKNTVTDYSLKALAREISVVQIAPISSLKEVFETDFCSLVRLIQITMIRVQQVVLRTLCNYFGLPLDALAFDINNGNLENIKEFLTDKATTIDSIGMLSSPQSYYQNTDFEAKSQIKSEAHCACVDEVCKLLKNDKIHKLLTSGSELHILKTGEKPNTDNGSAINMYYIHKGSVSIIFKSECAQSDTKIHTICRSGRFACVLPILSGLNSPFEIMANEGSVVLSVSNFLFHKITILYPLIIPILAEVVLNSLTPFLKNITFGFDWDNFESGANVYNQGTKSESIYIILHGRLRLVRENNRREKIVVGEFTRNDFVGIGETLEQTNRTASLTAVRSTEVVVISASFLNFLQKYGDQVMSKIAQYLSNRIGFLHKEKYKQSPDISGYSTVALVPASNKIPIKNFASELNAALNSIGPTAVLDSNCMTSAESNPIISRFRYLQLITQLETDNIMVLWVCDTTFSYWTKQCILHADLVLIVASIDENFSPNTLEKQINQMNNFSAPRQLVLLHKENLYKTPENTAMWLKDRKWVSDFHHIRCQPRMYRDQIAYQMFKNIPSKSPSLNKFSDISRLARRLTNNAVGLVLGGGGARGFAHLGVIRALEKAEIPIDMIGGTSIGAFMGALYATYGEYVHMNRCANKFAKSYGSVYNQMSDLTLPLLSFFTGARFNSTLYSIFKDVNIEDLLLPYFCTSTDISSHQLKIHTSGTVWRYVRASMTLLNFLPPVCDPHNNHLLIDGGYLNVLPADIMLQKGAKHVIAINVSRNSDDCLGDYGDHLSGWTILWNKLNPFSKKISIPSLSEIQERLCYINCSCHLEKMQNDPNILYVSPPIQQFSTLGFNCHQEISEIGFEHFQNLLNELKSSDSGNFHSIFKIQSSQTKPLVNSPLIDLSNSTIVKRRHVRSRSIDRIASHSEEDTMWWDQKSECEIYDSN